MLGRGEFAKYHALGNDYLVVDGDTFGLPLDTPQIVAICDRHRGVGSDGILVRLPHPGADAALRILNPDGSEAEKSGNGLRIFARSLFDLGYTTRTTLDIVTPGGQVQALLRLQDNVVRSIRVAMGRATFASEAIAMAGAPREVVGERLDVAGEGLTITAVSVGNPHCVCFVPRLDATQLRRLGPLVEHHPSFLRRTNVQLACVQSRTAIDILIWERGAGETLASGSSSCAVAAAARRLGLVDGHVEVRMPGGTLDIDVADDFGVTMTGPATPVFRGQWLG